MVLSLFKVIKNSQKLYMVVMILCSKRETCSGEDFKWKHDYNNTFYHGTIIQTGKTCNKTPYYMCDSVCKWFIVKKANIFWRYVKHFWILAGVRKCRILIGLCK